MPVEEKEELINTRRSSIFKTKYLVNEAVTVMFPDDSNIYQGCVIAELTDKSNSYNIKYYDGENFHTKAFDWEYIGEVDCSVFKMNVMVRGIALNENDEKLCVQIGKIISINYLNESQDKIDHLW